MFFSTRNLSGMVLDFGDASLLGKLKFTYFHWGSPPLPNGQIVGKTLETNGFIWSIPNRIILEVALINSVPATFQSLFTYCFILTHNNPVKGKYDDLRPLREETKAWKIYVTVLRYPSK